MPEEYSVDGITITLNTDFRVWLKYQFIQRQNDLTAQEVLAACSAICCKQLNSASAEAAAVAMMWFASCADVERVSLIKIPKKAKEALEDRPETNSFFWDFRQLWYSFKREYGVDLYTCGHIHWWEFVSMAGALSEESEFKKLSRLRSITDAEFLGDEKTQKELKHRLWEHVCVDKIYQAIPE